MYSFSERLLQIAPCVREALRLEPKVRLCFQRADMTTIAVVMFCLMWQRACDASSLYGYLDARGCPFDRTTIEFLLNAFDGDDPRHHLWTRGNQGDYLPLVWALHDA